MKSNEKKILAQMGELMAARGNLKQQLHKKNIEAEKNEEATHQELQQIFDEVINIISETSLTKEVNFLPTYLTNFRGNR